jgi:hypothetical protein
MAINAAMGTNAASNRMTPCPGPLVAASCSIPTSGDVPQVHDDPAEYGPGSRLGVGGSKASLQLSLSGLTAERVVTAVRRDAEVRADRSVFFTSDRVAVRATCRVGFGFPRTAAPIRIRLAAS